jgi:glycerophosphoryl diester phosphodiesterase
LSSPPRFEASSNRFAFEGPAEIIAHRGFSAEAPENTLAAIEAAIDAGAAAVEFDLRAAADGTPVLFHDETLRRTTDGTGRIGRSTVEELRRLDAGSWFGDEFVGERVPTLEETLDLIGSRLDRIYVEIKDVGGLENVDRIAEVAGAAGSIERIVFIAMDWTLLDRIRASEPMAAVGYIVRKNSELDAAVERVRGDPAAMIDFDKKLPLGDPSITEPLMELGIPMAAWTVDDPSEAARLVSMGVTRLTTNQVQRMVEWRASLGPEWTE